MKNGKQRTRMVRINDEIQREIAEIIRTEIKDPRMAPMVSVVKVETTQDLKFCKVYISVLGTEEETNNTMEALKSGEGFIRKLVAERVNLRLTPKLIFKHDDSLEYSIRMSKLIDEISAKEEHKDEEQQL
ncbi:MAG: 30S ribosome-binding factor RbfA [Firmicutes bacterium]|nr:30S ribosome-binding factor RbfA [Bacillota bacterium]MBR0104068.1 30S ribosome-binding factor RbfA [Bacillota bacterium]MBR2593166.1 30S ribosome-binding factor RbfA [Bacillota bacterium]